MHVSWSLPSGTESAVNFEKLFDRLTGANETTPVSSPPERPFRMRETQTWLVERAYDIDTSPPDPDDPNSRGPAFLNWRISPTKPFYALRPSLYRALTTASESVFPFQKWTLEGDFGDDPGPDKRLVSWGDQVLKILSWDEETGIKVQPPSPPYPSGPIEVMIGSRRSNAVPMTQWNIPVTYTLAGKGSLQYRIEFTLRLRGDVHRGRAEPSGDLSHHPVVLMQLADSDGTVTASGQYKPDPDTTIRWGGSKSLTSFYLNNQGATATADFILGSTTVNPSGSTAIVNLSLMVVSMCDSFTTTASGTQQTPLTTILDGFLFPSLTTTINLQTGVLQGQSFTSSSPLSTPNGLSATLSWPSVSPEAAPTSETPR